MSQERAETLSSASDDEVGGLHARCQPSEHRSERSEQPTESAMREQLQKKEAAYPGPMNPRVRRLIVSGVLGGLLVIVVVTAAWNWLR